MFAQVRDIDTTQSPKTDSVFIIHTLENQCLYMSRSFTDHDITKYTSRKKEYALIYFTRQAAEQACKQNFGFTGLHLAIERIPVNGEEKLRCQQADSVKKFMQKEARKKRGSKPWK